MKIHILVFAVVLLSVSFCETASAQTYPMNQQSPVSVGFYSSTSSSSYQFGWRFKVNTGGVSVLRLGCNFPANTAKTVTLFDFSSQQMLGQVSVQAGSGWQFKDLTTPIVLNNNSEYVIVGHTTDGYYYKSSPPAAWKPTGDIQWIDNRYNYTTSSTTFPTSTLSSHYGVVDFGYVKGLTVISGATLPSGAVATSYNTDVQADFGTPPYGWTKTTGSLPAGLSWSSTSNVFRITGTPTGQGTFNFTVEVTDAVSDTATKAMTIYVMPTPVGLPFSDDFSSNTGWQLGSNWSRAACQAYSANGPNRTEPGTDHTSGSSNNRILGHKIGADYDMNMVSTVWATSPPFNCVGTNTVSLRFYRWLGVSLSDKATIQVSNNGTTWTNVWVSPSSGNTQDSSWQFTAYDISAHAVGHSVVQVRFGIGPTTNVPNTGWCIDDVLILDAGPELQVKEGGPTGTIISDDDAVGGLRDFGQINTSTNSSVLNITLKNNGANTINLQPLVETGPDSAEFFILSHPSYTIQPGQSTYLEVQFYSTTAGVKLNTIEIPHDANASGSSPFEINLRAEAVIPAPNISVTLTSPTGPIVNYQDPAAGTARDFGTVQIGSTSPAITLVITNTGTGTLYISAIDVGGTWWNQYNVVAGNTPASLANGQSHSFTVSFSPTGGGVKDAHLRIVHNDATQTSPFEVPVTGEGIGADPIVEVEDSSGPLAHNDPATGPRNFGSVLVAATSASLSVTVTNSGGAVLVVGNPTLAGTNPGDFAINAAGFGPNIAVGASASFQVTFTPTAAGVRSAIVRVTHNDPLETSPFSINVTGTGANQAPQLVVRKNGATGNIINNGQAGTGILNFGNRSVTAGPSTASTVYVENTGTAPLTISIPDFNPTGNVNYVLDTTGFPNTLAVNASATFTIAFDPSIDGVLDTVIEFTHNDGTAGSPFLVSIRGTGISPEIEVHEGSATGPTVTSGSAAVVGGGRDTGQVGIASGPTLPLAVVVKNAGSQTLNITSTPTLAGLNAGEYTLDLSSFGTSVAPGLDTTILVIFDPSSAGLKDASVEFTHDDTTNPSPFTIPVVGTGLDPNAVQITTSALPTTNAGEPYPVTQMQAALGTPAYVWSVYSGSMPPGLVLSSDGLVSGSATNLGTSVYTFTIRVGDQTSATNERSYSMIVIGSAVANEGDGGGGGGGCATKGSSLLPVMLLFGMLASVWMRVRLRRRALV